MNAAETLESYRAFLNGDDGQDIRVRRYVGVGPSRTRTEVVTRARVVGYQPNEILGNITQGDRKVIALADTLTALLPLTVDDKLLIDGIETAIKAVDSNTRKIGSTLIALEIQVAG